ncbi:hypothetical protein ISG07_20595 [Burkholderia pseudomallei]|uniref:hypothetical protein n=1 Tax=Burkholderia pseudomallei TaxID=28450 RepID=UPI0019E1DDD9|nr:hypothetical protein [Burkholderia pseudomallei]MBF3885791.1 hypothetical protein [Burkholderia pseudomallei]MBF3893864.1 hypothetical protein [Burkholderia pseudomallei]
MNDQQQSRTDALTDDQRQALGEAISEHFGKLDSDEGIRTPDGRILRAFDYCDSRTIDDLINRAIVPTLAASASSQPAPRAEARERDDPELIAASNNGYAAGLRDGRVLGTANVGDPEGVLRELRAEVLCGNDESLEMAADALDRLGQDSAAAGVRAVAYELRMLAHKMRCTPADAGEAVGSVTISKPGDSATGISFMSLNERGRQTLGKGKHLLYADAKSSTLTVGEQQTISRAADTLEFHGLKTEATELRALLDSTQQPSEESKECTCPSGDGSLRRPCPVHPPTRTSVDLADDVKRDAERYRTHIKYEYETIYMPAAERKGLRPLTFTEYKASADQVADAARTQGSKS